MTVREIYETAVQPMPAADRLELAKLILHDIGPESLVDYREEWSEEDLREFTLAAWRRLDEEPVGAADAGAW